MAKAEGGTGGWKHLLPKCPLNFDPFPSLCTGLSEEVHVRDDLLVGRLLRRLVDLIAIEMTQDGEVLIAGQRFRFKAPGNLVSSGIYLYRLQYADRAIARKLVVIRQIILPDPVLTATVPID